MVKFGKKFFFDAKYLRKNKKLTIAIILIVASLILTTFFITSRFYNKSNNNLSKKIETHQEIKIKLYDNLPYMLSYFKTLENIKISDIKISYPDNFVYLEDTTNCTEEQITTINGIKTGEIKDVNIDEAFSCMTYKANLAGSYNIGITVGKEKFNSTLTVIDSEAPVLVAKDFEIYEDERYSIEDFVESCSDNSQIECQIKFLNTSLIDYSKYTEPGTYPIKLAAYDRSDNRSEPATVNLTIKEIMYYEVTFNTDGGSAIESQTIREGETISYPKTPSKEGHIFKGWYYNNKEYEMDMAINSDITITAKWEKIQTTPSTPSGNGGGYTPTRPSTPSTPNNKCIKYSEVYENVSIYNYQFTNGSMNDCMGTTSNSSKAINLMEQYYSEATNDFQDFYINGQFCNDRYGVNTTGKWVEVTYNNKIVGYLLTITVSCGSNVKTYELDCSSQYQCTLY